MRSRRNEASMALLRSVGMRLEAHFRQSLFWKGKWVDDMVFGLLRSVREHLGAELLPRLQPAAQVVPADRGVHCLDAGLRER